METSNRFTNAVTNLYNAFHNGTLNYGSCEKCAVGNIVGHSDWYLSCPSEIWAGRKKKYSDNINPFIDSGYSRSELGEVERIFVLAFKENRSPLHKESQFNGLCRVIEYLCELEGIPNVMDYTKLFETENDAPAYKLESVLS